MKNDLISIIVPVYNVEKYISKCIESILNQTYRNYELLIINDGSTDNSFFICNEYSKQDNRIILFSQENKGVSVARNFGIKQAKGKWITFIDADDYVDVKYLESFNLSSSNYVDFYIQQEAKDYYSTDGEFLRTLIFGLKSNDKELTPRQYLIQTSFLKKASVGPYAKVYSLALIKEKNLFFIENSAFCEDLLFTTIYLSLCKKIFISNIAYYHYRNIEGSISLSRRKIPSKEYLISFKRFFSYLPLLLKTFHLKEISPVMETYISGSLRGLKSLYKLELKKQDRLYYMKELKEEYITSIHNWRFINIKYSSFFWILKTFNQSKLDIVFTYLFKKKKN